MSTDDRLVPEQDLSAFAFATMLVRGWRRIVNWSVAGGLAALLVALLRSETYVANAAFAPQLGDQTRSISALAGQLGVPVPIANLSQSSAFYADLLSSRVLLSKVAHETVVRIGKRPTSLPDLFEVPAGEAEKRERQTVKRLEQSISTSVDKNTGVVRVTVSTQWPAASYAILNNLLVSVDRFNNETRRSQAASERRFIEERVKVAESELRTAEDRLEQFLNNNRQAALPPTLAFVRERLQRDFELKQQIYGTLRQSLEDVRVREVRDTPVITVIEPPMVADQPTPTGRLQTGLVGFLIGGVIGAVLSLIFGLVERGKQTRNPDLNELETSLREVRGEVANSIKKILRRKHAGAPTTSVENPFAG